MQRNKRPTFEQMQERLPALLQKFWKAGQPWLDVVGIALWGFLLLRYWFTGQLSLLIHPNYNWLTVTAALALLGLAGWKGYDLRQKVGRNLDNPQHITLLPNNWGSSLLIMTALIGLLITPRAFASQTALQRGVNDSITLTQVKPQAFRGVAKPEERSLIEWIRTFQVYPEPDAYAGQKVKIQGFAVHPDNLPEQYFLLTRFVITCCAADAYPVSLPIKLSEGNRNNYKVDQWFEVEGQMITETLAESKRQAVVQSNSSLIRPIEQPKKPYDY
jgi:uncharacterized repeat protein (TIGR03943 family)